MKQLKVALTHEEIIKFTSNLIDKVLAFQMKVEESGIVTLDIQEEDLKAITPYLVMEVGHFRVTTVVDEAVTVAPPIEDADEGLDDAGLADEGEVTSEQEPAVSPVDDVASEVEEPAAPAPIEPAPVAQARSLPPVNEADVLHTPTVGTGGVLKQAEETFLMLLETADRKSMTARQMRDAFGRRKIRTELVYNVAGILAKRGEIDREQIPSRANNKQKEVIYRLKAGQPVEPVAGSDQAAPAAMPNEGEGAAAV